MHRYTDAARAVMVGANREAERHGHQFICAAHLVAGVLTDDAVESLLSSIGADAALVRSRLDAHLKMAANRDSQPKDIIAGAIREADERSHSLIGVEHVALSLVADPNGTFCAILDNAGVDVETFRAALANAIDHHPVSSLPDNDVLEKIPELRPLFVELDSKQALKEKAVLQGDFETAAKYRDETDRIKREIEDRFSRLGDG